MDIRHRAPLAVPPLATLPHPPYTDGRGPEDADDPFAPGRGPAH
ncbi:hypothetical protein NX794_31180 [Streptomyces sp. LP11]|uniref:Uncharacterized protein n=1 Tax=Streptomyces pyxinicus TaxID=2970331 RepID=A0ABT2BAU9_9ACTN|nr:hypothetical protein [Streptomyces sp. LP11]MCS0605632.1 hypothetical protein [Streptomyces sp. LP11]